MKAGTKVTWVNKDTVTHTVTSQGISLFDSGNLATGATFSYTFARAGTYPSYCTIHPDEGNRRRHSPVAAPVSSSPSTIGSIRNRGR